MARRLNLGYTDADAKRYQKDRVRRMVVSQQKRLKILQRQLLKEKRRCVRDREKETQGDR